MATTKKNTKKAPAKKAPKAKTNGANGHAASPRSAKQGGDVPAERYAKDPKSVAKRLKEKSVALQEQAANALVRAEGAGIDDASTKKLRSAISHFEAAEKALA